MHRLSGFVHQDDLFDGTLTVLEHLTFIVSIEILLIPQKLYNRIILFTKIYFRQISNWTQE